MLLEGRSRQRTIGALKTWCDGTVKCTKVNETVDKGQNREAVIDETTNKLPVGEEGASLRSAVLSEEEGKKKGRSRGTFVGSEWRLDFMSQVYWKRGGGLGSYKVRERETGSSSPWELGCEYQFWSYSSEPCKGFRIRKQEKNFDAYSRGAGGGHDKL